MDRRAKTAVKESGERWTGERIETAGRRVEKGGQENGDSRKGERGKVDRRVKTAGKESGERWIGERRQQERRVKT